MEELVARLLAADGHVELSAAEIEAVCEAVTPIITHEPALLELKAPVTVCGDLRGTHTMLSRIFARCGNPATTSYLFLGNFAGSGKTILETVLLVLALKALHPTTVHVLQGLLEDSAYLRVYGMHTECKNRSLLPLYSRLRATLQQLSIAAVVEGETFCVSSGIFPDLTLDQLRGLRKPFTHTGQGDELVPALTSLPSLIPGTPGYEPEFGDWVRNAGYGHRAVEAFLTRNNLQLMCKGRALLDPSTPGYEERTDCRLIAIHTAPNAETSDRHHAATVTLSPGRAPEFTLFEIGPSAPE